MQALVQWMQKHARVLTTPSTSEGQVAGPSLPEEVEELHNADSAASEAMYWPVRSELLCAMDAGKSCMSRAEECACLLCLPKHSVSNAMGLSALQVLLCKDASHLEGRM